MAFRKQELKLIPPQNEEAEMSALGAMLISQLSAYEVVGSLKAEDFYTPVHQQIFTGLKSLVDAKSVIDLVTAKNWFLAHGNLAEIGGIEYLVQLAETVPSAANAAYYAGIVADNATRRGVIEHGKEAIREAHDPEIETGQLLSQLASSVRGLAGSKLANAGIRLQDIELAPEGASVPTGIPLIDESVTCGGAPRGQLTVVAGKQKHGKTPLMTQVAWYAAVELGLNVVYALFSDLTPWQWKSRLIKLESGWGVRPDSLAQLEVYNAGVAAVNDAFVNLDVYDARSSRSAGQVEAFCTWLDARSMERPIDLVCCDYLQVMRTAERFTMKHERMEHIASYLDVQAGLMNAAFVVGSQLTDRADGSTRARYAEELEQHCGLMIEIDRDIQEKPEAPNTMVPCELVIKYSRFGESGPTKAWWDVRHLRFLSEGDPKTQGQVWGRDK